MGGRKLLEVMNVHGIELGLSWLCTYHQTHQVVYIKNVQLFVWQSYLNKEFFFNLKKWSVEPSQLLHFFFFFYKTEFFALLDLES